MWFIYFVFGVAAAITLGVLGTSVYLDHVVAERQAASAVEVIPIPRAAPRSPKPQTAAVEEDETVREPKPRKSAHVRTHRPHNSRRATW